MKHLGLLLLCVAIAGCSSSKSSGDPVGVNPSPTNPSPTPSPSPTPGPATQFGAGQHQVGTAIAAGRYYSDPAPGCYWERQSGLGGTLAEIITNDIVSFDAGQWIVDILPGDRAFMTSAECGTWFNTARRGNLGTTIPPGVWQVGSQITAGTYTANAQDSCYWERRSDFQNSIASVIANGFADGPRTMSVTIPGSDVGFFSSAECGSWTRGSAIAPPADVSAPGSTIASARGAWQVRTGSKPGLP